MNTQVEKLGRQLNLGFNGEVWDRNKDLELIRVMIRLVIKAIGMTENIWGKILNMREQKETKSGPQDRDGNRSLLKTRIELWADKKENTLIQMLWKKE